ncbi:MAG: tetratricopeptide repeat protein [Pirellulales bacterium]
MAREAYTAGHTLFQEKKYAEAADKFEEAAERWPDSLMEEDALYMQGESLFFDDQYHASRNAFDTLVKKYENSRHLDRVTARQFAIGRFWDSKGKDHAMLAPNFFDKTRPWFDTHGNGLKCYENIRLSDPTGPLADDALMAQSTAYFIERAIRRRRLSLRVASQRLRLQRTSAAGAPARFAIVLKRLPRSAIRSDSAQ